MKTSTILRMTIAIALAAAVVVSAVVLPAGEALGRFLEWLQSAGAWGPAVLAAVYAIACVLFVPGSVLTLGAGFLFGLVRGVIAVSIGSVAGATLAFLVGRTLARGWVEGRIAAYPRFRAIDRAVGREGFKIVLLVRLSPIFPFNLLNYALGLTKISLGRYVLASWLGMLPGTILYVYVGSALQNVAEAVAGGGGFGGARSAFFFTGLLMAVVATIVIARVARKALQDAVDDRDDPAPQTSVMGKANA